MSLSNDFLDMTPKAQATKSKINKWDYIKLKMFLPNKRNHQQREKTTMKRQKIFINHISDKGLISKIY